MKKMLPLDQFHLPPFQNAIIYVLIQATVDN